MAMWQELRALDQRRSEILNLIGIGGMPSDMFERYCGSEGEMMFLAKLGLIEIRRGRVYLTANGRNRAGTR
jgi:hypothetical protein